MVLIPIIILAGIGLVGEVAIVEQRDMDKGKGSLLCVSYGCGELGHIKPKCPNRVRRVKPQGGASAMIVDGCLAGLVAKDLRIDTGADRTVVRRDYIPERAYTLI